MTHTTVLFCWWDVKLQHTAAISWKKRSTTSCDSRTFWQYSFLLYQKDKHYKIRYKWTEFYIGGNLKDVTKKSSNTSGQKHYLNNTTVHFNKQLKKVRHQKKRQTEASHGQLVPNTAKAKGTWLQADTSYCSGIWKYNKVRQQKAAGNGLRRGEEQTKGGKQHYKHGKIKLQVAPNSPIFSESSQESRSKCRIAETEEKLTINPDTPLHFAFDKESHRISFTQSKNPQTTVQKTPFDCNVKKQEQK